MGEIGIPRREFLYDIKYWEARRIARGYSRRNRLEHQLLRITAFMTCFSMRENKMRLTPERWLPLPWEKDDEDDEEEDVPITEEEKQELLDLIQAENDRLEAERKSSEE